MYGTQTFDTRIIAVYAFENDVEMYGTQTSRRSFCVLLKFENDVEMYGTQTISPFIRAIL